MPNMNFLPMQPLLPDLGSALAGGIDAGSNAANAFTRARRATIDAAIAHQQMQHAAIMNPLMEQQQQVNADTAGQKAAAGIGLTKAQTENLLSEKHNRDMLTPFIQQMMGGHAQMFNALADKAEAYKNGIMNFLHGIPGFGIKDAPGSGKGTKTSVTDLPTLIGNLTPEQLADPGIRKSVAHLVLGQISKDTTGKKGERDPDGAAMDQGAMETLVGNLADQRLQKLKMGQGVTDAWSGFLSKFMGGKGATPQDQSPTPVQGYQKMQAGLPMGMGAALPSIPAQDGSTGVSPVPQQAAPAPRMGFLGLGGPAAPQPNPTGVQAGGVPSQPLGAAPTPAIAAPLPTNPQAPYPFDGPDARTPTPPPAAAAAPPASPYAGKFNVGDILSTPRGRVKVVGIAADGEPLVAPAQ